MFDAKVQKTKGSLILNKKDEVAFCYGADLPFMPRWANIDVERGEIFIGAAEEEDHDGMGFKLGEIDTKIYERIEKEKKILLVKVQNGDIRYPQYAEEVPLMIATQAIPTIKKREPIKRK